MDWHIYGVIEADNFSLSEKYKKELLGIIGDNHPKKENFLKEIEDAIGRAKGVQNLRGSQKPSEIRKNLKKLNKLMRKTIISLSNLDPYSKHLIEDHTKRLDTLVEYEKKNKHSHRNCKSTTTKRKSLPRTRAIPSFLSCRSY